MSISRPNGISGSSRFSQLASASRASSAGGMTSKQRPVRVLDHGQEILAVAGAAAGFGGDVAGARDAVAPDLGRADAQRIQRALDGVAAQRPVQRHPLAQPDRPGIGVDDLVAVDRRPRHQEPAIVGAEIDGGESVRETTAVPAPLRRGIPGHFELFPWSDGNRGKGPRRARLDRGFPVALMHRAPNRRCLCPQNVAHRENNFPVRATFCPGGRRAGGRRRKQLRRRLRRT